MISVIIPIFNDQDFLGSSLKSLIEQTYEAFEVICIDDGSTDISLEIAKDFSKKDSRIKVFTKPNGGVSSARNLGLSLAKGEFIFFMDGDDVLPPNALKVLVTLINKEKVDAVVGQIEVTYEAHSELKESDSSYYKIEREGVFKVKDSLIDSFHSSSCGILFRRKIIESNGLRYPEGLHYEDAYWHWVYFSKSQFIYFTKDIVYNYVRHRSSIMSSTFEGKEGLAIQHLLIGEAILEFWEKEGDLEKHSAISSRLLETYFWFSVRYSPQFEISRVAYECGRILRKFDVGVDKSEVLTSIKKGDLGFLYQVKPTQNYESSYARYLQVRTLINRYFPHNTLRRKIMHYLIRKSYRVLRS